MSKFYIAVTEEFSCDSVPLRVLVKSFHKGVLETTTEVSEAKVYKNITLARREKTLIAKTKIYQSAIKSNLENAWTVDGEFSFVGGSNVYKTEVHRIIRENSSWAKESKFERKTKRGAINAFLAWAKADRHFTPPIMAQVEEQLLGNNSIRFILDLAKE